MASSEDNAILLIETVRDEMARGKKHYDIYGRELNTVKEVLEALQRDKHIEIEVPWDPACHALKSELPVSSPDKATDTQLGKPD